VLGFGVLDSVGSAGTHAFIDLKAPSDSRQASIIADSQHFSAVSF
jgi:hypothetical protein